MSGEEIRAEILEIGRQAVVEIAKHEEAIKIIKAEKETKQQSLREVCSHVDDGSMFYGMCKFCGELLG